MSNDLTFVELRSKDKASYLIVCRLRFMVTMPKIIHHKAISRGQMTNY